MSTCKSNVFGKVGKYKGKFQKKSKVDRRDSIVEATKRRFSRLNTDEHDEQDSQRCKVDSVAGTLEGRRIVEIAHLAKIKTSIVSFDVLCECTK